jgi:hypothetical protein
MKSLFPIHPRFITSGHHWIFNESMGGLDDLMMGNVSEEVSESDEQIAARIAAAQQRIAAIKKDEQKASVFDEKLAKILSTFSSDLLDFVIYLIDNEVPSLTILAMVSLASNSAGKICYDEFHQYIAEPADFSLAQIENSQVEERISLWWTFIFAADHISKTIKLHDFREKDEFIRRISKQFSEMLKRYLIENQVEQFNDKALKKLLKKYADAAFSHNPLDQDL